VPKAFQDQRWRAVTFDKFILGGWARTNELVTPVFVNAGDRLLADTSEVPNVDLTDPVTVQVNPKAYNEPYLLVPGAPETVDRGANVLQFGEQAWFAGVQFPGDTSGPYTATAAVPRIEVDKGLGSPTRLPRKCGAGFGMVTGSGPTRAVKSPIHLAYGRVRRTETSGVSATSPWSKPMHTTAR